MTQTLPPTVPPSASPSASPPTPASVKFSPSTATMEPEHDWGVAYSVVDRTRAHVEGASSCCFSRCIDVDGLRLRCMPAEVITAIEYSRSGELLATGNKGGRISIYSRRGSPLAVRLAVSGACWEDRRPVL